MSEIYFTKEEISKTIEFANKMKTKHPHFADKENDAVRTENEIFISVVRGKLAEIALYKYLKEKHKDSGCKISELDFNIYQKGVCDDFDLKFNDYTISIKSSKPFSSCLLIETEKYQLNENGEAIAIDGHTDNIPDFYAFVKIDLNLNEIEKTYASICGAISHKSFWKNKKVVPRGTFINKTNMYNYLIKNKPIEELDKNKGVPLLASNYGLHIDMLKPI